MAFTVFGVISPSAQALIAVNRLCAVFLPLQYERIFPKARCLTLYLLACAPAALLGLCPVTSLLTDVTAYARPAYCWYSDPRLDTWGGSLRIAFQMVGVALPSAVALTCYMAIFLRLYEAKSAASREEVKRRARGSMMMFVSFLVYLALIAPSWALSNVLWRQKGGSLRHFWLVLTYCVNFGVNPVGVLVFAIK